MAPPPIFTDGVDPARGHGRGGPVRPQGAACIRGAAQAYLHAGTRGIDQWLSAHPRHRETLVRLSEDELVGRLDAELARQGSGGPLDRLFLNGVKSRSVARELVDNLRGALRETVRREAVRRVDERILALEGARRSGSGIVEHLRRAEPGSPSARLAEMLSVRGDAGDEGRLRERIDDLLPQLRAFRAHLFGNSWEMMDFPHALNRARISVGVSSAPEGSLAWEAIESSRGRSSQSSHMATVTDGLMVTLELGRASVYAESSLAFVGASAIPMTSFLAGVAFGFAVARATEDNIADRRALGAALGL